MHGKMHSQQLFSQTITKKEIKASLGFQPRLVLAFPDLHSTSVATCRLPKRLGL